MKRLSVLAMALVAVFAASATVVASASAVEFLLALWLSGGAPLTAILLVEIEGETKAIILNAGGLGVKIEFTCSEIRDGWIGPESLGFFSELLTLGGVAVPNTPLTGTALLCTSGGGCTEPEVWPDGTFESEAELMVDGTETFFVNLAFKAGTYFQCLVLGVTISELCEFTETNPVIDKMTNEANGTIDGEMSKAIQTLGGGKEANCTTGGTEVGEAEGLEIILAAGSSISVSSE